MTRAVHILLAACLLLPWASGAHGAPTAVIDVRTGLILDHDEAMRRWSPASLTKLMTALLAFRAVERGELTLKSPVRMSANAARQPPAKAGYGIGAILTLDNALKLMIVKSANDVAVAVAEAVAGSEAAFVGQMNAEAVALGMTGTRFANPNGLGDDGQYTTARDMALLAREIRARYPQHAHYFAIEAVRTGEEIAPTYNILIARYAGADGMKTGFICKSGFNLVGSATRAGRTLIAVVLGESSQKARTETAARLLTAGFAQPAEAGVSPQSLLSAEGDDRMADMTATLCTDAARASRWDGRQVEGMITFENREIVPLTRNPVPVVVALGGAEGQSAAFVTVNGVAVKSIPVPTPRPVREAIADEVDRATYAIRPGFDVPVPGERPVTAN